MRSKSGTVESIQALRAIAATVVALFHCQLAYVRMGRVDQHSTETYLLGFGAVGVHIFFVISGFIMVVANRDAARFDIRGFYWRRLVRIYPAYWICCAVGLMIDMASAQHKIHSARQFAAVALLLPSHAPDIIGAAWTLPYELYFYICFGLAMLVVPRAPLRAMAVFFLMSVEIGAAHHWKSAEMHVVTNSLLIEFIAGAVIGKLFISGRLPARFGPALSVAAVAMFVGGIGYGYHRLPSLLAWGVPSAILVLGVISIETEHGLARFLRPIAMLGNSSYALYLIHPLIILLMIKAGVLSHVVWLGPMAGTAALVALCVGVAHIMHITIEAPLHSWLKGFSPSRAIGARVTAPAI